MKFIKKYFSLVILSFILFNVFISNGQTNKKMVAEETLNAIKLIDSYRHMENIDNKKTKIWLKKETLKSINYLNNIPKRDYIIDKLKDLDKTILFKYSNIDRTKSNNYFFLKRELNENSSKLYLKLKKDNSERLLFDPKKNKIFHEYSINYFKPSWDEKKILISLVKNGNEFSKMIILDIENKKLFPEIIDHCNPTTIGSADWLPDNSGFVYTRFKTTDTSKNIYMNTSSVIHKVNSNPKKINVLFSKKNNPTLPIMSEDFPVVYIDNPEDFYTIGIVAGATPYFDAYYIKTDELYKKKKYWKLLFRASEKITQYVQSGDSIIYVTSKNASNFKICSTSISNPNFKNPKTLVLEKSDAVIDEIGITSNGLFFSIVKNGVTAKLYNFYNNQIKEIKIPKYTGKIKIHTKGKKHEYLSITTQGWINKPKTYVYNFKTNLFVKENLFDSTKNNYFDDLIVEEVLVKSHDGEEVPLSIIYKKGLKKNGKNPVLMRGYGAYGISMKPNAYNPFLLWSKEGCIYAVAHVRGGGEKGDNWYYGGFKKTKPNTWKDFIACTNYLIDNNYTSNKKTAIWSSSAGGILIGRAMIDRPDLFSAVIIDRGVLNPIRLESSFNGSNNAKEYGSIKKPEEFSSLLEMDSFYQLKKGISYPSTLIIAGMNDKRIAPWQSYKFAAKLMDFQKGTKPILFKAFYNSGHGDQLVNKEEELEKIADIFSFAFWQFGDPKYLIVD